MSLKICSVGLFSGAPYELLFVLHKDALFHWDSRAVICIPVAREVLLKRKAQYSWPPHTNLFRSAPFYIENILYFFTQSYNNKEVNCTEPSPSLRVPCFRIPCRYMFSILPPVGPKKPWIPLMFLFILYHKFVGMITVNSML
jgi:hypothetical protein